MSNGYWLAEIWVLVTRSEEPLVNLAWVQTHVTSGVWLVDAQRTLETAAYSSFTATKISSIAALARGGPCGSFAGRKRAFAAELSGEYSQPTTTFCLEYLLVAIVLSDGKKSDDICWPDMLVTRVLVEVQRATMRISCRTVHG